MKFLIVAMMMVATVYAQKDDTVVVYTNEFKPLMYRQGDSVKGMDAEILEGMSSEMGKKFNIVFVDGVNEVIDRVANNENSIAMAGITITSDREAQVDFKPYIKTGLGIVVRNEKRTGYFESLLLVARKIFPSMGILSIYVLVVAMIFFIAERGTDAISDKFIQGYPQSVWYAYVTISTIGYGDIVPKRWKSKFIAIPLSMIGFCMLGNVVGDINTAKLVIEQSSTYYVNGQDDLGGRKVATKSGTSNIRVLKEMGATPVECANLREAYGLLILGEVDAVVGDKLSLVDFHKKINTENVVLLDSEFADQSYGVAMAENSPLEESVSRAILKMHESGRLKEIINKWEGK
jgi:ABC-type amino acid transport substrate-binding protein